MKKIQLASLVMLMGLYAVTAQAALMGDVEVRDVVRESIARAKERGVIEGVNDMNTVSEKSGVIGKLMEHSSGINHEELSLALDREIILDGKTYKVMDRARELLMARQAMNKAATKGMTPRLKAMMDANEADIRFLPLASRSIEIRLNLSENDQLAADAFKGELLADTSEFDLAGLEKHTEVKNAAIANFKSGVTGEKAYEKTVIDMYGKDYLTVEKKVKKDCKPI